MRSMQINPTDEDITDAISESVGQAGARFVYAEGSEERAGDQNDSMDLISKLVQGHPLMEPAWRQRQEEISNRNPELDRIDDRIRDWARQNLEEMRQPE